MKVTLLLGYIYEEKEREGGREGDTRWRSWWGIALLAGSSRVRFPMVSLGFFIDLTLPTALWPWSQLSLYQKWVPGILIPSRYIYIYMCVCVCVCVCVPYIYIYTGCPRRKRQNFGRVFLMLKYTDITQNTYIQSWTVAEIMAREVWNFDSCYTLIDYQIQIKTGRNMWFL